MGFLDLTSDFWAEIAEKTCKCNKKNKISGRFFVNDRKTTVRAFCGRASVCDPTHRQVRAMDGAPGRLGLVAGEQARAKAKCGGSSPFDFAQGQNAKQKRQERRWEF
jgi:hypothetical protein